MSKFKVLITDEESRLEYWLENGWIIDSVTAQKVSAGGESIRNLRGNFCFVLKK